MFGLNKTRYSPIAVDFGADSLKLLQVTLTDPPQLLAAACAVVPEHARTDPGARHAFFLESLKHLLRTQPFKGNKAVCYIPAYQTLVQHFQVPRSEGDDLQDQAALHLRQRMNVDPSRMVIRTFPVTHIVRDGATRQELICLAASRDAIMGHLETAHRAKLDIVGMQCEPVAILQAFGHLYRDGDAAARTTCFIDMGGATTKVVIAHGMEMVFAKTIHAAGDHFTRNLAAAKKLSFSEARTLRIQTIGHTPPAPAMPAPPREPMVAGVSAGQAAEECGAFAMIAAQMAAERATRTAPAPATQTAASSESLPADADTLECLIDELQLSIRYHQTIFPNRPVEKLIFLGGESNHIQTCQAIARALRIGAQLGDPLARLSKINQKSKNAGVDTQAAQPGWGVPLGLCLGTVTA